MISGKRVKRVGEVLGSRVVPFEPTRDLSFDLVSGGQGSRERLDNYFIPFALPGNVTLRFGQRDDYQWVTPSLAGESVRLLPSYMDLVPLRTIRSGELPTLPRSFMERHQASLGIILYAVEEVRPEHFADGTDLEGDWFYCRTCSNVFHRRAQREHSKHDYSILRVETRSFPLEYFAFKESGDDPDILQPPPILRGLVKPVKFYDKHQHFVETQGGVYGVNLSLKFRRDRLDVPLHLTYDNHPAILSYSAARDGIKRCEGFVVELEESADLMLDGTVIPDTLAQNAFLFNASLELESIGVGHFQAEALTESLQTAMTILGGILPEQVDGLEAIETPENSLLDIILHAGTTIDPSQVFSAVLSEVFTPYNQDALDQTRNLLGQAEVKSKIKLALQRSADPAYLRRFAKLTLAHSLAHAMLNAAEIVGGIDLLDEYYRDFGSSEVATGFAICETNPATGGIRIVHRNYLTAPLSRAAARSTARDFCLVLEDYILGCPVRDSETYIERTLFEQRGGVIQDVRDAISASNSLRSLRKSLFELVGAYPPLHRVFLEKARNAADEFDLNFEVFMLYSFVRSRLHRHPTEEEFTWLVTQIDSLVTSYLTEFENTLKTTLDPDLVHTHAALPSLLRLRGKIADVGRFRDEVLKRRSRTCIQSCPACLGVDCSYLSGPMSGLLDQDLLRAVVVASLRSNAITLTGHTQDEVIQNCVKQLKERGIAILLLEANESSALNKIRSSLISTTVGKRVYDRDSRQFSIGDRTYLMVQFGLAGD